MSDEVAGIDWRTLLHTAIGGIAVGVGVGVGLLIVVVPLMVAALIGGRL